MSAESVTAEITQDDKIMAAVGHATIIWPVLGIIAPLVIWATQREKSAFVAFQALQATLYHVTLILAGLVCGICYLFTYFGAVLGGLGIAFGMVLTLRGEGPPPEDLAPGGIIAMFLAFLVMLFFYLLVLGLMMMALAGWLAYIAYGLYGAVASFRGRDFRYVVIGPRLERYLRQT